MDSYDINIRWAKQSVEIHLMQWDSEARHTVVVGGNCKGAGIFDAAIGSLYEKLPCIDRDGEEVPYIILKDAAGNELWCEDEENHHDEWLKNMVVGMRIIAIEPELVEAQP